MFQARLLGILFIFTRAGAATDARHQQKPFSEAPLTFHLPREKPLASFDFFPPPHEILCERSSLRDDFGCRCDSESSEELVLLHRMLAGVGFISYIHQVMSQKRVFEQRDGRWWKEQS